MRSLLLALCAVSIAGLLLWNQNKTVSGQITVPQPAPAADELQSVTLIFGSKDMTPARWDGSAGISRGRIEKITGYHFGNDASVDGTSWKCATHPWSAFSGGMHPNEKPQPQPTPNQTIGVTIAFRAPADAELQVKVPKGEFSFRPMDIPEAEGIFPLGATVEVYRTPIVQQISQSDHENDYPSMAVDGSSVWVAWQGYKSENDQVFLRRSTAGQWGERMTVTERPADVFMTGVAAANGKATIVWSERDGTNWHLKSRTAGTSGLSKTETITSG
ncbi:MAG: hypothetical protein ABIZ80_01345, partial [Bryobacteraceae bacterium]